MGTRVPEKPRASLALPLRQTCCPAPAPHFFRTLSADHAPAPKPEPPRARPQHACASVCTVRTDTQGQRCCGGTRGGAHRQGLLRNLSSVPRRAPVSPWAAPPGSLSFSLGTLGPRSASPSRTGLSFRGAAAVWKPGPGEQTSRAKTRWTAVGSGPRPGLSASLGWGHSPSH